MTRIAIRDANDRGLAFDLVDILQLIEPSIDRSWMVRHVQCFGLSSDQLLSFSLNATRMTDRQFHQVASGIDQTLDGEFCAFLQNQEAPSIIIRALDGQAFEIETDDATLIDAVSARFSSISFDG